MIGPQGFQISGPLLRHPLRVIQKLLIFDNFSDLLLDFWVFDQTKGPGFGVGARGAGSGTQDRLFDQFHVDGAGAECADASTIVH